MNHITIIYSNVGDVDCLTLQRLWNNIPEDQITLITINPGDIDWEDTVDNAIASETDTLLLCGHGTSKGLLYPDLSSGQYIIHENNYSLIHARRLICIWCYASSFGETYNLTGFYTSMFISNLHEALDNCCFNSSAEDITSSFEVFCDRVNQLIINDIPMSEWVMRLGAVADVDNEIEQFNYFGLTLI